MLAITQIFCHWCFVFNWILLDRIWSNFLYISLYSVYFLFLGSCCHHQLWWYYEWTMNKKKNYKSNIIILLTWKEIFFSFSMKNPIGDSVSIIHVKITNLKITQMTQISMTRNESNNGNDALKIDGNKPGWLIMTNSMTRMTNGYQHYDQQWVGW
mgnify:CR=1 FL=1